jgi:hypothetical protein
MAARVVIEDTVTEEVIECEIWRTNDGIVTWNTQRGRDSRGESFLSHISHADRGGVGRVADQA